ncbi:MAG: GntR family transcriptional regulator [Spirochaetia bacterium]|nr:GntR family transcriptional regulator [Spirochaetia bacterium]
MEKHIPIEQQCLSEQVYHNLKLMILSGVLNPGERIPEGKIAEMFQVSRTPIREALKKLSDYGLVDLKPRSRSTVTEITMEQAQHIAELRSALENFGIQLLLERVASGEIDSDIFTELQEIADECRRLVVEEDNRAKAFEKDTEFHLKLIEASHNEYLYEAYERLDARIQLVRLNMHVTNEEFLWYISQHGDLLNVMQKGDIKAAQELMHKHVFYSFNYTSNLSQKA